MEHAYKESLNQSAMQQTTWLLDHVGPRITAAALGLADARQLKKWRIGETEPRSHQVTLRLAVLFRVAWAISSVYSDRTAALFLRSANPQLNDEAPLMVLRDGDPDVAQRRVLAATEAFLAA
jgi:hypothetical protein